jgi:hypothetical protein
VKTPKKSSNYLASPFSPKDVSKNEEESFTAQSRNYKPRIKTAVAQHTPKNKTSAKKSMFGDFGKNNRNHLRKISDGFM